MLQELAPHKQSSDIPGFREAVSVLDKFVSNGEHKKPHPLAKAIYFWYEDYQRREIAVEVKNKKYTLTVLTHPYAWERGHALEIALSDMKGETGSFTLPDPNRLYLSSDAARMGFRKVVELLEVDVLPLLREQILKDSASK